VAVAGPVCSSLAELTTPSTIILLVDTPSVGYRNTVGSYDLRGEGNIVQVHNGGVNVGFADGHAKWLKAPSAKDTTGWLAASGNII